jgi:hypothetical protein
MVGGIGMPELLMVLFVGIFWLVPVVAVVWAVLTLHRVRTDTQAIATRLYAIERLLQAGR